MANLKNLIKQNVNSEVNSQKLSTSIATVVDVDLKNMLATIELNNQFGNGSFTIKKVPIVLGNKSLMANSISIGEKVIVEFVGSSLSACKIIGINYNDFNTIREQQKHVLQDLNISSIKPKELKRTVNVEDLLFGSKEKLGAFAATYTFDDDYNDVVDNIIGCYGVDDIGITHTNNKNTVKLCGNGDVLISNGLQTTIRLTKDGAIDINTRQLNIQSYGDINISTPGYLNLTYKDKKETKLGGE